VLAKMKSDQDQRKAKSETVTTAFRLSGRTIETNVRIGPAPSTRAACMISFGIPLMNAVNISTPNGTAIVESARIRPGNVLSTPRLR
jgi:hypothetical protein